MSYQLNARGFLVNGGRKKPGPKPGTARKTALAKKAEHCEKDLARRIRASDYGWTADQIQGDFISNMHLVGGGAYYAVKAGLGHKKTRSWMTKFQDRFGLRQCNVQMQYKSRKGGEVIYDSILKAWGRFDQVVAEAISDGGEKRLLFLGNMDETSMGKANPKRVTVPAEQLDQGRPCKKTYETTIVPYTLGLFCSDAPGFGCVPMTVIHTNKRDHRTVFN
eukprot:g18697.t1